MSIAGIDIGTTGCKCTVYSSDGKLLGEAYSEYNQSATHEGRELDPQMVWERTKEVIAKATDHINDLVALTVTSFGEATVLLDEFDHPTMNTILYTDDRGKKECTELAALVGKEKIISITGMNPAHLYSMSKLMWIKRNMVEAYERAKYIFLYGDFISYMLTGDRYIDFSLATRTMAFDLNTLSWSQEIFGKADIDISKMSHPVKTGSRIGTVKPELLREWKMTLDITVLAGCHDQIAVAIGSGVLDKGMAADSSGTVECITPVYDNSINLKAMAASNYAKIPYIVPGYFVTYAFSLTGGALLKWYRDSLAGLEAQMAQKAGKNAYDVFNEQLSDKPTDLLVLPYFAGAATPYMDADAKGAIIGLTLETKSIDIYQALMEAVVFEMKLNIELLKTAGIEITSLRASGGGTLSSKWLQMKADILKIPIMSLGSVQSGTLGTVMLAGVNRGIYENLEQARDLFVKINEVYYPRKVKFGYYEEKYQQYQRLYPAVKTILN